MMAGFSTLPITVDLLLLELVDLGRGSGGLLLRLLSVAAALVVVEVCSPPPITSSSSSSMGYMLFKDLRNQTNCSNLSIESFSMGAISRLLCLVVNQGRGVATQPRQRQRRRPKTSFWIFLACID